MVGLGPPTKAGSLTSSRPSSSSSRLAGLSSVGDTGEPVIERGLENAIPQASAARRTPGTSWTLAYQRRRWGSWSEELASPTWREHYQREEFWKRKRWEEKEGDIDWVTPLVRHLHWAEKSASSTIHWLRSWTNRWGPSRRNTSKHPRREGRVMSNRRMKSSEGQETGRRTQTGSRWDSAALEVGPRSHVWCAWRWLLIGDTLGWVWNWKPVEHSWLLKASLWELQFLPTVKEWESGGRVNCRLRPTSPAFLINNDVWWKKTSAGLSELGANMHHRNICRTFTSSEVKCFLCPREEIVPRPKAPHPPPRCYHSLPGGFGESGRAKQAPARMWGVFLWQVFCLDG